MKKGYRVKGIGNRGFSLIEIIVSVTVMAIVMIPVALMAIEYVRSIAYADSLTTAANLGRREMGIVNNLSYTDPMLNDGYNNLTQLYAGSNLDLRRMANYVTGTSNNLKRVRVQLYPTGTSNQLIEIDTYVMNVQFGAGSAGGAQDDEADSFAASAGTLSRTALSNVTLQNRRRTGNITIVSVIITPTINKTLTRITLGGDIVFSGSQPLLANQATTVPLQKNFFMNSDTIYPGANGGNFTFNSTNRTHTITIVFVFYDDSQSSAYSWTY